MHEIAAYPYLDYILVTAKFLELGRQHLKQIIQCLQHYVFIVNIEKSHLLPS